MATWSDAFDFVPLRIVPQRFLNWATNQWLKRTTMWIRPFGGVALHYGVAPIRRLADIYEGDFNPNPYAYLVRLFLFLLMCVFAGIQPMHMVKA